MLKFELKDIGIIKRAELDLPGLTVITGKNSTGKSTIGKALYAVVEGSMNLNEKYEKDRNRFIQEHLRSVGRELSLGLRYSPLLKGWLERIYNENDVVISFVMDALRGEIQEENWIQYLDKLDSEIKSIDVETVLTKIQDIRSESERSFFLLSRKTLDHEYVESSFAGAQAELAEIKEKLINDPGVDSFAKKNVNNILQREYSWQIQPLRWRADQSEICLYDEDRVYISTLIRDNSIVESSIDTRGTQFDNVYLIDDPTIIDKVDQNGGTWFRISGDEMEETHKDKLMERLRRSNEKTLWEQAVNEQEADKVKTKLEKMLRGEFASDESGSYFVYDNGNKLRLTNMATGSKTIAILEILLKKGAIHKNTLLIFDEPESHLHPEWQNELAEVMILLVKLLGIKVVMTTHSANFLYALETYAMKHVMTDKCAYYQVEMDGKGAVCRNVHDDIEVIYSDFLQYLTQLKVIRERLEYNEVVEDD